MDSIKKLKLLILLIIQLSCGTTTEQIKNYETKLKIDSILIKTDTISVFLRDNLLLSTLTKDGNFLYNFDPDKSSIQRINLKEERIDQEIILEKEGPKGIDDFVLSLNSLNDSLFIISGTNTYSFWNNKGDFLKKVKLDYHFFFNEKLKDTFLVNGFAYRSHQIFAIIARHQSYINQLMIYSEETDSINIVDIPGIEMIKNASIISNFENSSIFHSPNLALSTTIKDILISHRTYPDIVKLNIDALTISHYIPESKLYNRIQPIEKVLEVEEDKRLDEFFLELEKKMNFLPPIWDEQKNKYYRWGFKLKAENTDFENPSYNNYIFEMDSNFMIVKEMKLPEITTRPYRVFLKENKLYVYKNIKDELMFIRIWLE
ncbi:DUF4221 family protein [Algoriphagus confluentis]|uniref:DUF4221 domain-containing protein n=1 Tax=Algoriphagus confluentis TaxID=1697556 RepID=A0ABQ6PTR5_9BACT|nr:hypothetical protein Aconfl_39880 [Algoriphagus confluentis]